MRTPLLRPITPQSPPPGCAGTAAALAVTLSRPLAWNKRRGEWQWCKSWRFPDVTVRLGGGAAATADGRGGGAGGIGPGARAYLTVAVDRPDGSAAAGGTADAAASAAAAADAADAAAPEMDDVRLVSSDGSGVNVQHRVVNRSGVLTFSRLRLAATSAAYHGRRFRLILRVASAPSAASAAAGSGAAANDGGVRPHSSVAATAPQEATKLSGGSTACAVATEAGLRVRDGWITYNFLHV